MNILVGTTNRNKVRSVQRYLQAYDVQLVTPQDVQLHVRIEEDGATPIENARIKALAYYRSARIPTVAFDSGLYFLDLKEDDPLQPKTHVRRVQGRELNDEEMISYYRRIAADFGGRLLSAYRNGVALCTMNSTSIRIWRIWKRQETSPFISVTRRMSSAHRDGRLILFPSMQNDEVFS